MILIASDIVSIVYRDDIYMAPKTYTIFKRYADNFGPIVLCGRFQQETNIPANCQKATFIKSIIHISGYKHILSHKYDKVITENIKLCDLVILRLPSIIPVKVFGLAKKTKKPILAEAMGDPWDSYWHHSPLGKIIAPYMYHMMKHIMQHTDYALYVTNSYLQKKYPARVLSVAASNVNIGEPQMSVLNCRLERLKNFNPKRFSVATLGGINVVAKGHEFVIQAIAELKQKGIIVDYYLIGGGDQTRLIKIALTHGVAEQMHFTGDLPMHEVFAHLDKTDIYIQPSLQEGLPRSVIEAMSRGCPALGSATAGTPELLEEDCIFRRASHKAIAQKLTWFIGQDLMARAKRNFMVSKNYSDDIISERRNNYFDYIKSNLYE